MPLSLPTLFPTLVHMRDAINMAYDRESKIHDMSTTTKIKHSVLFMKSIFTPVVFTNSSKLSTWHLIFELFPSLSCCNLFSPLVLRDTYDCKTPANCKYTFSLPMK